MKTFGTHAFVNQLLVGLLVTIGFGGSIGLGTVWMRHRISVLADNNRDLEQKRREVERQIDDVSALVEQAMSLDVLRDQNEKMHLGLVEMTQAQINLLPPLENPVQRLIARSNRRTLERDGRGGNGGFKLDFQPKDTTSPDGGGAQPPAGAPGASAQPSLTGRTPVVFPSNASAGTAAGHPLSLQLAFSQ